MEEKQFSVIGMTCASCQASVTKAVAKLEGVDSVDVSLLSNSMKVAYDPRKTSPEAIEKAVDQIGYEAVLKGSSLNETQTDSIQAEWESRQKQMAKEQAERKSALIGSIALLIPLMVIAMGPHMGLLLFLMDMKWAMISSIAQLILTMFILFLQRNFFIHGFKSLLKRAPNMDSLVAIGGGAAFVYGVYGIFVMAYGYGIMDHEMIHNAMHALYFESAATIVTLVSLGKYLEARSKSKTSDALGKLVDLAPKSAVIERDGAEIQVATDQIVSGDIVVMRPGQRIPVDGIVQSGTGYVDQAAITGESIPVEKNPGDPVISATMNINGTFKFEATKVGADTTLAQIIRLVDEAGNSKAPIARLADQVSGIFVPVVIGIALITGIIWLLTGQGVDFALSNAIAVLVISCPCALGLATPVAIMVSTGKAAEYGILIKSAEALENLHNVNAIVMDKTGTITSGKPSVQSITVYDPELNADSFVQLAAEIETGSEHPLGKAIVEYARNKGFNLAAAESFEAIGGRGLKAKVQGQTYTAGNQKLMEEQNIPLTSSQLDQIKTLAAQGQTPLIFARNHTCIGMIGVADTIRQTSAQAIQLLQKKGIQVYMLTGDNAATANAIARNLNLNGVIADVLPAEKESVIRKLQAEGYKVAMVGDGINDAPALARAEIGIAIGAGTDIAIDSADIVLMKDNLLDVNTAVDLSNATIKNIRENLFWAFFYNILGIPVAAGLFYPFFGLLLSPMLGSLAMSLSSVCVVTNALRLRFFKPADETPAEIETQLESKAQVQTFIQHEEFLESQAQEPEKMFELKVEGMTCGHCQARVEKALKALPGVVQAEADVTTGLTKLAYTGSLNQEEIFQAVEKAGYTPLEIKKENSNNKDKEVQQTMNKSIEVKGMSCPHCQAHVKSALEKVDGVTLANVDLANGVAHIQASTPIADDTLIQAIEEAGYTPGIIRQE